ncbi:hypothetical protein V8F20_004599 [Naviculisporaceae sp. PSN 640]
MAPSGQVDLPKTKTAFMTLPTELRQLIIEFVINSPSDPPESPSSSQHGRYLLQKHRWIRSREYGIWQQPLSNPALNMMLANRQLHDEVKLYLQVAPTKYHVDVMLVKTYGLWPTWSIPMMPTRQYIESVSCAVRLFEPTPDLHPRFAGSLSFSEFGLFSQFGLSGIWLLYQLLANLFLFGPGYFGPHPRTRSFVIGTIIIDFLAPTDGAMHTSVTQPEAELPRYGRAPFQQAGRSWIGLAPEEELAKLTAKYLGRLFDPNRCYPKNVGRALWESVLDRLVLLVNGKEYKVFDVEQICKTYEPPGQWSTCPKENAKEEKSWKEWRTWVSKRRAEIRAGNQRVVSDRRRDSKS